MALASGVGKWSGQVEWQSGVAKWSGHVEWPRGVAKWSGQVEWPSGVAKLSGHVEWLSGVDQWSGQVEWASRVAKWSGQVEWSMRGEWGCERAWVSVGMYMYPGMRCWGVTTVSSCNIRALMRTPLFSQAQLKAFFWSPVGLVFASDAS